MNNFTYQWNLSDLKSIPKNGLKVFSCFAGSGGSTMGFKMSGCEVLGCNEIDPKMIETYKINHSPKYPFCEAIQTFKDRNDLPEELFNLDILDGSPPCSSFSMAGHREKDWGKKKKFHEGQKAQVLDDLFFHYIQLANKLKPKVVMAENVKGLISGNAKGYVKEIIAAFKNAGYEVQLFLLNAASMGVPQARERVFFIARRMDLNFDKLSLNFNEKPITVAEAIQGLENDESDYKLSPGRMGYKLWHLVREGQPLSKGHDKNSWLTQMKINSQKPSHTLTGTNNGGRIHFRHDKPEALPYTWWIRLCSFPEDYKFKSPQLAKYQMGMSVPPLMIHKIVNEIIRQWFKI
jgi:DNA (cytosine-5)-methyltransferase 1